MESSKPISVPEANIPFEDRTVPPENSSHTAPLGLMLEPKCHTYDRVVPAFALAIIALIWNFYAIRGALFLILIAIQLPYRGDLTAYLATALLPGFFILPGAYLAWRVMGSMVALFLYPEPWLMLSHSELSPGDPGTLTHGWRHKRLRAESMSLVAEGYEIIMKGGSLGRSIFWSQELLKTSNSWGVGAGSVAICIPPGSMHSWGTEIEGVGYRIRLKAQVPHWAHLKATYPIAVAVDQSQHALSEIASKPPASRSAKGRGLQIRINGNRHRFRPGEVLEGSVSWTSKTPPEEVIVRLLWYTNRHEEPVRRVVDIRHYPVSEVTGEQPFRFNLPGSPFSFAGKFLDIHWIVEAEASPVLAPVSHRLTLGPDGRAIDTYRGDSGTEPTQFLAH